MNAQRTKWWLWFVIVAGWGSSIGAIIWRGGAVEWFMAAVLSMVILVSGIGPAVAAARIRAERSAEHGALRDGGGASVELKVARFVAVPFVWVSVHDEAVNERAMKESKVEFGEVYVPFFQKELHIGYKLNRLRRGRYAFAPLTVTVGDWLGLTAVTKRLAIDTEPVEVLPALPEGARLGDKALAVQYAADGTPHSDPGYARGYSAAYGDNAGTAAKTAGIGPDSRPYRDGDSQRHIDWRAAARGRGLQTKLHEQEAPAGTFIVLDTAAASYESDDRLFDACAGWAAQAAERAAAAGGMVTLYLHEEGAGKGASAIRAVRSGREGDAFARTAELLRAMSRTKCAEGASNAASLMLFASQEQQVYARNGTVHLFTGDWKEGKQWGELAAGAGAHGCRLELYVAVRSAVPTFAMREQQRWLENRGVKVSWLPVPAGMDELSFAEEGGGQHVYAQ